MDRGDDPGSGGIGFDLLAQLSDMLVERTRGAFIFNAPDCIQEMISTQHLVRVSVKALEEIEFTRGEGKRVPLSPHSVLKGIDFRVAETKTIR